ncbi:MAG TPA: lysophospholipid acyltransferase family protein [Acetobacteraceae bacterium]|nr:lysophospholipid acyltransferase family protein [Acetobacteraceae bacterium]
MPFSPIRSQAAERPRAPARGMLRTLLDMPLFYAGLAVFGVGSLLWSLPAGALNRVLPARWRPPLGQFMVMAGCRFFIGAMQLFGLFRCDLRALDTLRCEGGLVVAPNHPTLLDAVLVISRLPRVVCITKAGLWDNWFLGGSIRMASYIRNDAPVVLVKRAVRELRAGRHLLIFPEGTRTRAAPVDGFRGGFALMAQRAGVPVQTVFLEPSSHYLAKGWPLFRRPVFPLVYRARLGRRFLVEGDVHRFVADLEGYFRTELGGGPA